MTKPIAVVFGGDFHCGSPFALAKPGFVYESQNNKPTALNPGQRWLWSCWKKTENYVKDLSKGHDVVFLFGGDSTEGYHHGHIDAEGAPLEQADMAVEILRPLARIASRVRVALGTTAHVGVNGERDRYVADQLTSQTPHRVRSMYHHRLEIGGRVLVWAHKLIPTNDNPVSESNGMIARARKEYWRAKESGDRPPDLVVAHHAHRSPDPIREKNIQVAICPCFQLPTNYGGEEFAGVPSNVGFMVWWPERNDVQVIIYQQETKTERVR